MTSTPLAQYTDDVREAVKGREDQVLRALGISLPSGKGRTHCPYPDHNDRNPSWRWDSDKARAYCTCGTEDIFGVVRKAKGASFPEARDFVGGVLGLEKPAGRKTCKRKPPAKSVEADKPKLTGFARFAGGDISDGLQWDEDDVPAAPDMDRYLRPPADRAAPDLPCQYLAHRLGVDADAVLMPETRVSGWAEHAYYTGGDQGYIRVGSYPMTAWEMLAVDGTVHVHRIWTAPEGAGKADILHPETGATLACKKLVRGEVPADAGVIWSGPHGRERSEWLIACEGIETGAALAYALRDRIERGEVTVIAGISKSGMTKVQANVGQRLIFAVDHDEDHGSRDAAIKTIDARRVFVRQHARPDPAYVVEPQEVGADWLDVLRHEGAEFVARRFSLEALADDEIVTDADAAAEERRASQEYIEKTFGCLPQVPEMHPTWAWSEDHKRWHVKLRIPKYTNDGTVGYIKPEILSTPLNATKNVIYISDRDKDGRCWYGMRVSFADMVVVSDTPRHIDVPRDALDGKVRTAELVGELQKRGVVFYPTTPSTEKALRYILGAGTALPQVAVSRTAGFHRMPDETRVYISPNGAVAGRASMPVELSVQAQEQFTRPGQIGNLEGWREGVAQVISAPGTPHWTYTLLVAFVGMLAGYLDMQSFGTVLSGYTSRGKTTAMRLGASVYGPPILGEGTFQSARTTDNAAEVLFEMANHACAFLDELASMDDKKAVDFVYMANSGLGKNRMRRDTTSTRPSKRWTTGVVLSSEISLKQKIKEGGGSARDGIDVRFPDVDVTEVNSQVPAEHFYPLDRALRANYGVAAPAFAEALMRHNTQTLRTRVNEYAQEIAGERTGPRVRAAEMFALLMVIAEIGVEAGVLPEMTAGHYEEAVGWAWKQAQAGSDAIAGADPVQKAVDDLHDTIAAQMHSRIITMEAYRLGERPSADLAGWVDKEYLYLRKQVLEDIATRQHLKLTEIERGLATLGMLVQHRETIGDRITLRNRIHFLRGVGKGAFYQFRCSELGIDVAMGGK